MRWKKLKKKKTEEGNVYETSTLKHIIEGYTTQVELWKKFNTTNPLFLNKEHKVL